MRTTRIIDVQVLLAASVVFLVELFFASRVYLLNKDSWYAPVIVTGCAIGALVPITLLFVDNMKHNLAAELSLMRWKIEMAIFNCFSIIGDSVVTAALCWKLSIHGTGVKRTQTILHQLFLYFITRGLLVTLNQVANLIAYEIQTVSFHWMPFHFISSKLYIITTLAILNAWVSLCIQMDMNATNASQCMSTICFDSHQANQQLDVETQSLAITPKHKEMLAYQ